MSSNERDRNRGESDDGFIEKLVAVNRVSKTVKGGRQFTFTALTVVGDDQQSEEHDCAWHRSCGASGLFTDLNRGLVCPFREDHDGTP